MLTLSSLCCCRVSRDTLRGRSSESTCHHKFTLITTQVLSEDIWFYRRAVIKDTHHSFDEVQVLGHHVIEVVCDEHSPDKQLRTQMKIAALQNVAKVPENTAPPDMVLYKWRPVRDKPWCSRSSWSRTRQTGRGELTLAQRGWTWRWPRPRQWSGCGPGGRRCPVGGLPSVQWI